MKVEIRIGDVSSNKRIKYDFEKFEDSKLEKQRMYDFLLSSQNCIIEDVDNFLLYIVNNGLMAFIVKDNPDIEGDDLNSITKFDPKIYKVFEIDNNISKSIQTEKGTISKNYFNKLMGSIMDDYYECLNFYYGNE